MPYKVRKPRMTKLWQGVEVGAPTLAFTEQFRFQLVHVFDTKLKIVRRLGGVDNLRNSRPWVYDDDLQSLVDHQFGTRPGNDQFRASTVKIDLFFLTAYHSCTMHFKKNLINVR